MKSLQMQLCSLLGVFASFAWQLAFAEIHAECQLAKDHGGRHSHWHNFGCPADVSDHLWCRGRDQYFYLGESIVSAVPEAMAVLVCSFIVNELADSENCGVLAGLFVTISNVANPMGLLLGNQLFGLFQPALAERDNFVRGCALVLLDRGLLLHPDIRPSAFCRSSCCDCFRRRRATLRHESRTGRATPGTRWWQRLS